MSLAVRISRVFSVSLAVEILPVLSVSLAVEILTVLSVSLAVGILKVSAVPSQWLVACLHHPCFVRNQYLRQLLTFDTCGPSTQYLLLQWEKVWAFTLFR